MKGHDALTADISCEDACIALLTLSSNDLSYEHLPLEHAFADLFKERKV